MFTRFNSQNKIFNYVNIFFITFTNIHKAFNEQQSTVYSGSKLSH